jgi:hypothetical protein
MIVFVSRDGGLAHDARSYWLAGRHLLDGQALYAPVPIDETGAYRYPPVFAFAWAPLALLPEPVFVWAWRLFCFACLRYLAGSWRNVGLWCLVPLTISELHGVNVTLPVAAAVLSSLRSTSGRPAALIPAVAALKIGPAVVIPFLWARRPASRGPLVIGAVALIGACLVTYVVAPGTWLAYVDSLAWQWSSPLFPDKLLRVLPWAGADFLLRLAVAAALIAVATVRDDPRLAYAAHVLAVPTLWAERLVPILATPRARSAPEPTPSIAAEAAS